MSEPPVNEEARPTVAAEDGPEVAKSADHQLEENVKNRPPGGKVRMLLEILGAKTVLLPVPHKVKGSRQDGWQNTTVESMTDPNYLSNLERSKNIAVLLGAASSNLCSIDIDEDRDLDEFLVLNPKLGNTLRSKGARGGNVWVRIRGTYPPLSKIKKADESDWGEWRSDGGCTMIAGTHPQGMAYRLSQEREIVDVEFNEIVWSASLKLPWVKTGAEQPKPKATSDADTDITERFGDPVYFGTSKSRGDFVKGLNQSYWSGLYHAENTVLYYPLESAFYQYCGETGIYSQISPDVIKQAISARLLEYSRQDARLAGLEKFRSDQLLNAIVSQLRGIAEMRNAFVDRPKAIHLANCMLRLEGNQCFREEFSPTFYSRNRSPIAFEETATCPRFLNELLRPAVSPDDELVLQKMAGLALLGDNLVQRFVILEGKAGRGKSQICNVIQAVVGIENQTQLRTEHLKDRFELFRYRKCSLLLGADVEPDFLASKGASTIKSLVGGDWLDAEQKGGTGSFRFQGKFNIFITSNVRLKVKLQGDTDAWRRRMLVVPFNAGPPKKQIPNFAEVLVREEGAGIVNWALRGLHLLFKDLEEIGDIRLTLKQQCLVDTILNGGASLRHFLQAKVTPQPGSQLTIAEIAQQYYFYCKVENLEPLSNSLVLRQLPELMHELFQKEKSNSCQGGRGFRGVGFMDKEVVP